MWQTYILDTLLQDGEEEGSVCAVSAATLLGTGLTLTLRSLVLRRLLSVLLGRKTWLLACGCCTACQTDLLVPVPAAGRTGLGPAADRTDPGPAVDRTDPGQIGLKGVGTRTRYAGRRTDLAGLVHLEHRTAAAVREVGQKEQSSRPAADRVVRQQGVRTDQTGVWVVSDQERVMA